MWWLMSVCAVAGEGPPPEAEMKSETQQVPEPRVAPLGAPRVVSDSGAPTRSATQPNAPVQLASVGRMPPLPLTTPPTGAQLTPAEARLLEAALQTVWLERSTGGPTGTWRKR